MLITLFSPEKCISLFKSYESSVSVFMTEVFCSYLFVKANTGVMVVGRMPARHATKAVKPVLFHIRDTWKVISCT
jgi:hypothetical protein